MFLNTVAAISYWLWHITETDYFKLHNNGRHRVIGKTYFLDLLIMSP